jgi:hypothetical protein
MLINGYTLFPFPANWQTPPAWQRAWENEIAMAVTGDESRQALRVNPRNQLTWLMAAWSTWELAQLNAAVMSAKLSGLACAPYWGRSSVLQSACGANSAALQDDVWNWSIGDYVYFLDQADYPAQLNYDVQQITAVNSGTFTLTLAGDVSRTYAAGALVWPLIYGEFTCKDMPVATAQRASLQATIRELASPQSAATVYGPGAAPAGTGIGFMQVGSTFVVS